MAKDNNGGTLGFESELWRAADALRSNMDAAEYKHVVLGLIFLKYISDAFEEHNAELDTEHHALHLHLKADYVLANPHFNPEYWGYSKVENNARGMFSKPPRGGKRRQKSGNAVFMNGGNANYAWIQQFIHHLTPSEFAETTWRQRA
jgi:type I restriction-modification system DNA methylase subunit